ncbi:hypothetical protein SBA1_1180023 [Candidatus Sulfotelmatobacter kueseliae]|uniref:Uncharacterized protein n=1 Tax=Candidatus Sulfotelmatobacter kueseliae TaxID=2042962 RepID=A0A2U3K1G4_9BACT|nr:hypothetical protein SBA1_1180023 [Candidatus Sulfotelmatobacter kueseliae]
MACLRLPSVIFATFCQFYLSPAIIFAIKPFVQRKFDNDTSQWNFGLVQAKTAWVLCLPANFGRTADLIAAVGSSLVRSFI